ncbi:hypothetical protein JAAARDRAFT_200547 [Jaapia argillacea MUCL 33604]|uniref:Mannosyltransferase n=1 Tax=Jaapia argillacea MUCL 33604 TaxID=933084 RepID=A0A067P4T9_9AGAM|nr:hypothetical protein JAAARDRAFT_200547 [Jaapia argillacea MUCL 33604]
MKVGRAGSTWNLVNQTLVFTIISSITTLLIQAYPEPRFLIPLLVPFVALAGNSTFFGMVGKTTWIISNIFQTSLSGVIHQAGVIPSLFHLRALLNERSIGSKIVKIVYRKTYMPSRHLLGVSQPALIFTIVSSVTILSIPPRQESRFLIPVPVPFIALVGNSMFFGRAGKIFWTTWIISNDLLTLLFGILHQGGVIPSLFHLKPSSTNVLWE